MAQGVYTLLVCVAVAALAQHTPVRRLSCGYSVGDYGNHGDGENGNHGAGHDGHHGDKQDGDFGDGHDGDHGDGHGASHGNDAALLRVGLQLDIGRSHMALEASTVVQVYGSMGEDTPQWEYPWLPKDVPPLYVDKGRCVGSWTVNSTFLPWLYTSLHNYSVTFQAMAEGGWGVDETVRGEHDRLWHDVQVWLRLIFCEVEMALLSGNVPIPPLPWRLPRRSWEAQWELGVYRRYRRFLDAAKKAVHELTRRKPRLCKKAYLL